MSTVSMWKFRASLLAAVLAIVSLTPALHAQGRLQQSKVNVPFGFEYGNRHFSPGVYSISSETSKVTLLRGGSHSALAMTRWEQDHQASAEGKVVFAKYGNQYVLEQVWMAGNTSHLECMSTKKHDRERAEVIDSAATHVELALLETGR